MELKTYTLGIHAHNPGNVGCVNEIASQLAGEKWTDRPACVDSSMRGLALFYNDSYYRLTGVPATVAMRTIEHDRAAIRLNADEFAQELPWLLVNTFSEEHEKERARLFVEFATNSIRQQADLPAISISSVTDFLLTVVAELPAMERRIPFNRLNIVINALDQIELFLHQGFGPVVVHYVGTIVTAAFLLKTDDQRALAQVYLRRMAALTTPTDKAQLTPLELVAQ
jgi:hypothetical protein